VRTTTFAGVDADARFKHRVSRGRPTFTVLAQLPLHLERRIQAALRMVLVCRRCSEQCEDPVAGRLHDVAIVTVDGIHHQFKSRVDDAAGFFRVEILHQFHGALDWSYPVSVDGVGLAVKLSVC
jgi:hypothetical protein